jgi:hypothetical protein
MVLGLLICAYGAFFLGVKEDLPVPPGSIRVPLSPTAQTTVAEQWTQSVNWRNPTADVYILSETSEKAVESFRNSYLSKRGWLEVTPSPGQPKDKAAGQVDMTVLSFSRDRNQIIIALTPARPVLTVDTPLNRAIRSSNMREQDLLAIVVYGQAR